MEEEISLKLILHVDPPRRKGREAVFQYYRSAAHAFNKERREGLRKEAQVLRIEIKATLGEDLEKQLWARRIIPAADVPATDVYCRVDTATTRAQ